MSVIDDVRREREDLARVLKKHTGIRRIVEDLYPDSAHFIYELLQNAEDVGATEASFRLSTTGLVFEHNGRPFEARDVYAITDIGEGTKAGDDDKIGRFGVGFKAVFAYSETPRIWSPTLCFKISDIVLPSELSRAPDLDDRTRFEFPFNNPKKPATTAFAEVELGLTALAETTLLFLTHLTSVRWQVGEGATGQVLRVQHPENHIEVLRHQGGRRTASAHYLKFDRPVQGLEKQRVAVAFALDFLPNVSGFDAGRPLAQQMKVISANPGRVAVFFPAEKETSGLRFHLHAPFVPELSRASIKETPANLPLFEHLASLTAASLHHIRDLGLLTPEFLEVLPNSRDPVTQRYKLIRTAVVEEMNQQPLTPTQSKSHAPARYLIRGKASLKNLLGDEDIEFLVEYEDEPPRWAAGVAQKSSNADRFLEDLDINRWDVENFVAVLKIKTAINPRSTSPETITPDEFMDWLRDKSVSWLQELYALLLTDYLAISGYSRDEYTAELGTLQIVRVTDGNYAVAGDSFFATEDADHDEVLQYVDPGVFSSGKGKIHKENARVFLREIGVREVGEAERVEAILKQRYTFEAVTPNEKIYKKDLKRFVALVEAEPSQATIFAKYYIFECVDQWQTPGGVFLDRPFLETGLVAYYDALGDEADRFALAESYQNCGVGVNRLVKFALAVGATERLAVLLTSCQSNPDARQLVWAAPGNRTQYGINLDFQIPGLEDFLETADVGRSRLVWRTLCGQGDNSWTTARYRNNSSFPTRTAHSQLVCVLRDLAWVPQTDGQFVRPAEADRDLLPPGFPFDPGWDWLEAIGFGEGLAQRSAEQSQRQALAKELGFDDDETLERARRFAALPTEVQRHILAAREHQEAFDLPEHEPSDPRRRAERVAAQAADAHERITEERTRSVSVGRDAVKQEAGLYLQHQYTNPDGQMICQVCKEQLPFQLDDGSDYFEKVELLPELRRHHKQNYLALCPNHAAMFQYANGSTGQIRDLVVDAIDNEVPLVLAQRDMTIYFTKTHLADLKAVIAAEGIKPDADDSEWLDPTGT